MLDELRQHLTKRGYSPNDIQRTLEEKPAPLEAIEAACDFLRQRKHSCGGIWGPAPERFGWCGRTDPADVCREVEQHQNMERENEKRMKRARRLDREGHTCVEVLESFPVQIRWCRQPVCTESKGVIQTIRDAFKTTPRKPAKKHM